MSNDHKEPTGDPTRVRRGGGRIWRRCAAAVAVHAFFGAAHAASSEAVESTFNWSGKLELLSDSRERGLSNSANRPGARVVLELLHSTGIFGEIELTSVSKAQYPGGRGLRVQANAGYRFGDPDGWMFEVGAQQSRFPGARQPGGRGYELDIDAASGEFLNASLLPTAVSFTTTEAFASVRRGPASIKYFHTISRDFFGISGQSVCAGITDFAASFNCFERGAAHSRGSQYLELEFRQPLSRNALLAARYGNQRVRNWSGFDTRSFSLDYRHSWRAFELSIGVTRAKSREKGVYDVQLSGGRVRDPTRTTLALTAGYAF